LKTPARYLTALALSLLALGWQAAQGATTILPSGETCFSALTPTSGGPGGTGTGFVGLLGPITAGTGGTSGTYGGVALTGGSGTGATANITVSGGVTQVAILNPGVQYVVGDVLSAAPSTIGNVTSFSVSVASVAINSSLAGGTVAFYIPNTLSLKQTWQNSTQTILNQNPVTLDANGCAIIYGVGMYREVLQDSLGNTIWDQVTTDTSAYNSTFWAGVAGGTPNVITVTDVGFNGTDGSVLNFTALATNTGPTTINPSGYGAISVEKDTTAGPLTLSGGEIIQGNVISVVYRASDNAFHILNPPIQTASGNVAPLCGATNLKITNGTTPSSVIAMSASQVNMISSGGININRSNVSVATMNITTGTTTSAVNGMDGESPSINSWIYLWFIDNGSAPAALGSLASGNGLAPVLPSGYTYICRMGAMRVDGSGNLYRTLQYGQRAQYTLAATSNTATYLQIASGSTSSTMTSETISSFVPPTASVLYYNLVTGASSSSAVGPDAINTYNTAGTAFDAFTAPASTASYRAGSVVIEIANTIYYAGSAADDYLFATGWKDTVNAP
jgi:hypothetical protein